MHLILLCTAPTHPRLNPPLPQVDPMDAHKNSTSVFSDIIFGENPHWKMQKHGFHQNTLDFPKLPRKIN